MRHEQKVRSPARGSYRGLHCARRWPGRDHYPGGIGPPHPGIVRCSRPRQSGSVEEVPRERRTGDARRHRVSPGRITPRRRADSIATLPSILLRNRTLIRFFPPARAPARIGRDGALRRPRRSLHNKAWGITRPAAIASRRVNRAMARSPSASSRRKADSSCRAKEPRRRG
jgi:hypothetical protein